MENQVNAGDQNTLLTGQNQISQPFASPEKIKKNYLMIGGLGLVSFVVFGFGGYYLGKRTLKPLQSTNRVQSQTTQPLSATPTAFLNWKTYVNDKFAFEIKYPQNWTSVSEGPNAAMVQTQAGQQISGTVSPRYDTINFTDEDNKKQFEIAIFEPYTRGISTKEFKDSYLSMNGGCDTRWGFTSSSITTIKVDSMSFLRVRGNSKTNELNSKPTPNTVCYYGKTKQGNLIVLSVWADSSSDNFSLFDQIISTFKFKIKYSDSDLSELKTAGVLVQDGSYYGPPFDPDLFQLEVGQSNHLFAKSDTVNLKQYLGKRVKVHYREVKGIVMGEQQLVIVESVE